MGRVPPHGVAGSSPLARGLRIGRSSPRPGKGIIPARAGFTYRASYRAYPVSDHPRSRGVYVAGELHEPPIPGSSPLARGLQYVYHQWYQPRRIIPARAGFTTGAAPNPRAGGGSSPLARGLQGRIRCARLRGRIIPARAGFTYVNVARAWLDPDHPRSRGVYSARCSSDPFSRGSSPLARGLPLGLGGVLAERRIIPARAGFTRARFRQRRRRTDHPRSRGVYMTWSIFGVQIVGSSPLARGLPRRRPQPQNQRRIIPARAGFTRLAPHVAGYAEDHPRSRGVYTPPRPTDPSEAGSSRLARGLQPVPHAPRTRRWIIPARAGFTCSLYAHEASRSDHPRSRGVYHVRPEGARLVEGSSPLARGLLVLSRDDAGEPGIIPARAGFTGV